MKKKIYIVSKEDTVIFSVCSKAVPADRPQNSCMIFIIIFLTLVHSVCRIFLMEKYVYMFEIHSEGKIFDLLLDNPYVDEVTLKGQNLLLKCCLPLELLTLLYRIV